MTRLLFILTLAFGLYACDGQGRQADQEGAYGEETLERLAEVDGQTDFEPRDDSPGDTNAPGPTIDDVDVYIAGQNGLLGVRPGSRYVDVNNKLRRAPLDGRGEDVYFIDAEDGTTLGYATLDPDNERLIGDVYITSDKVVTEDGIRIGNSVQDLRGKDPGFTLAESYKEDRYAEGSRTRYNYRFDGNVADNPDVDNINPTTRIDQIRIPKYPAGQATTND